MCLSSIQHTANYISLEAVHSLDMLHVKWLDILLNPGALSRRWICIEYEVPCSYSITEDGIFNSVTSYLVWLV